MRNTLSTLCSAFGLLLFCVALIAAAQSLWLPAIGFLLLAGMLFWFAAKLKKFNQEEESCDETDDMDEDSEEGGVEQSATSK